MNERIVQFRVGVMVLATVIITAILIIRFDGFPALVERPYALYLTFPEAPGISVGTPVRKSGIRIGRVTNVQFAEDLVPEATGVIVTVHIDADRKIRRDEAPEIDKQILGDAVIEFVPVQAAAPPPPEKPKNYQAGEMIEGQTSPTADAFQVISSMQEDLGLTMQSIARTSDEIGLLSRRVNELLRNNDEQFTRILAKAETSLDNINDTARNANGLISDPKLRENLTKIVNDLPKTLEQMNEALVMVQKTFETADRNLQNVEGLTKPLGERGPTLVANVEQATQNLNSLIRDMNAFTQALSGSEGTLGKLINDPALHDQISGLLATAQQMLNQAQPILKDVRAFTDKIARHPEVFTRGILQPSSGIK